MSRTVRAGGAASALVWVVAVIFVLLAAPRVPAAPSPESRAKAAQLQKLRQQIKSVRKALDSSRGQRDRVRTELRQAEQTIGTVGKALRSIDADVAQTQARMRQLQRRRGSLQQQMAKDSDMLGRQLRASYMMGRQEQLKLLLNQTDPAKVQRALVYFDYLNRARSARIRVAQQQVKQLQWLETEIAAKQHSLKQLQAQKQQQKELLENSRAERKRVLAALASDISSKGQELQGMLRDQQQLEKVVKALEHVLADIPMDKQLDRPFASLRGKLPWPVSGRIVVRYGSDRGVGGMKWHGVMISAPAGTEVHAISHGRVAFAGWLRGYGLLLIIDHGHGYMSLYGHNQSMYKDVGEWVQAGEVIASVGDSGGQRESGLYFELRRQGNPVNPSRWCRAGGARTVGANR